MVEYAADSAIEPVNPRVVLLQLLPSQGLPELDLLAALALGAAGEHPGVGALAVGADGHEGFQAEAQQQVA